MTGKNGDEYQHMIKISKHVKKKLKVMYSNDPNKYHIISAMLIGVQPSQSMDIVIGCHRGILTS